MSRDQSQGPGILTSVLICNAVYMSGHLRFLTFMDLYGLDTDILITFLSVLRIYTDLYAPKV